MKKGESDRSILGLLLIGAGIFTLGFCASLQRIPPIFVGIISAALVLGGVIVIIIAVIASIINKPP